jgi:hypothetical protein
VHGITAFLADMMLQTDERHVLNASAVASVCLGSLRTNSITYSGGQARDYRTVRRSCGFVGASWN